MKLQLDRATAAVEAMKTEKSISFYKKRYTLFKRQRYSFLELPNHHDLAGGMVTDFNHIYSSSWYRNGALLSSICNRSDYFSVNGIDCNILSVNLTDVDILSFNIDMDIVSLNLPYSLRSLAYLHIADAQHKHIAGVVVAERYTNSLTSKVLKTLAAIHGVRGVERLAKELRAKVARIVACG